MIVLQLSPRAKEQLQEIVERLDAYSPEAAEAFMDEVERRLQMLTVFPHMGPKRSDTAHWRYLSLKYYTVTYYLTEGAVVVTGIQSGSMERRDQERSAERWSVARDHSISGSYHLVLKKIFERT